MKNRFDFRSPRSARGFSLMEISVVLVVLGVLGFSLWKLVPAFDQVGETDPAEAQLALADEAIVGFVLANHRLPCPDTNGDGLENHDAAGCEEVAGAFPHRTLGLRPSAPLRYGVYQPADQALTRVTPASHNTHIPPLPPEAAPLPAGLKAEWPLEMVDNHTPSYDVDYGGASADDFADLPTPNNPRDKPEYKGDMNVLDNPDIPELQRAHPTAEEIAAAGTRVNGLDFCARLRAVEIPSVKDLTIMTSNGLPVAYAIAHPGANNAFDGGNATAHFAAPYRPASDTYDDQVLAAGFNELAARLSCPAYLARAAAAGHAARAAYDHYLFALAYLQYRAFALDLAYGDLEGAETDLILGAVGLAGSVLGGAYAAAVAIIEADEALGIAVAALGATMFALSTALGIADFILGLGDASEDVAEAVNKRIEAEVHARKMLAVADATAERALLLDEKGLRP